MLRLLVVAAVSVAALGSILGTLELDRQWESFKDIYGKKYAEGEELMRRLIWEKNLRFIEKHNLEAEKGLHTYILGENEFTDMTHKEFVSLMNGFIMPPEPEEGDDYTPPDEDLPTSVDWRTKGYVTEIKNQKLCGSCWAFSATGSLEGQTFKKTGKLVSLSEQNLIDCSKPQGDLGCLGGWPEWAFQYVKDNGGIDTEDSYPYKDHKHLTCHFDNQNVGATVTGFVLMKNGTEDKLQYAAANVGPISVGIDASWESFQHYKSGIYSEPRCSKVELDHAVLVVGYSSSGDGEYWIVKNSWGTRWGMEGYFEMARNKDNMCGIATHASYPTV